MNNPDVKQIVKEWLEKNGYGGLYDGDVCGCTLDDLFIGGNDCGNSCQAGYKVKCTPKCYHGEASDWHIQLEKIEGDMQNEKP